jgi:hypothetical protein
MDRSILQGKGRRIVRTPETSWRAALGRSPEQVAGRLAFMGPDHHAVRNLVVREVPGRRSPIRPREIARQLALPLAGVERILSDLERNLFFVARDHTGAVSWAYPVTVERTPHRLRFSTGERAFGA